MNLHETENGIRVGDIVTVIEPTIYKKMDRSEEFLWLGSELMEVGKSMKVIEIKYPWLVLLENGYLYDLNWINPLVDSYDTINNKLAVL